MSKSKAKPLLYVITGSILLVILILFLQTYLRDTNKACKTIWAEKGASPEQIKILENSKNYIDSSGFYQKDAIDYSIFSFENINADLFETVQWSQEEKNHVFDKNDLVVTIGSVNDHDFAQIVVQNKTHKAIGHIPVK